MYEETKIWFGLGLWKVYVGVDEQTPRTYETELVREFYYNNANTLKNIAHSGKEKDMKKQPQLDTIRVRDTIVDVSIKEISRALFEETFDLVEELPKYDFKINSLKGVKKLNMDDKLMNYRWLAGYIAENDENALLVNRESIYNHTLKFLAKAWWSMVKYNIVPTTNNNNLGATNVG